MKKVTPAPTFVILNRSDNTERLVFDCRHGTTTAEHLGGNGDTLRAAAQAVIHRHGLTCRCVPLAFEDLHESLAYMRARLLRDLASDSTAVEPAVLVLAHGTLAALDRHDCPCDPHVIQRSKRGMIRLTAYHREGCGREVRRGRTFRWLDLAGASA